MVTQPYRYETPKDSCLITYQRACVLQDYVEEIAPRQLRPEGKWKEIIQTAEGVERFARYSDYRMKFFDTLRLQVEKLVEDIGVANSLNLFNSMQANERAKLQQECDNLLTRLEIAISRGVRYKHLKLKKYYLLYDKMKDVRSKLHSWRKSDIERIQKRIDEYYKEHPDQE